MLYSDEETKKSEEKFQRDLDLLNNFTDKDKQVLQESLMDLNLELYKLVNKKQLSAEEMTLITKIKDKVQLALENTNRLKSILDESIFRKLSAHYHETKKLAAAGDEFSKEFYTRLRKQYHIMLTERFSKN
jgi:acetyl-CoA carboxylase beta subunit